MCGIGGIVGDSTGLDGGALLAALRHRGPDHQAEARPAADVWLCAARLAISDPSPAGNQPMRSADGALTIVHNGEIYNAAELRRQLEARGARFRSRCDTEVLLAAYAAWGDALVDRLDGMFAFALHDGPRRRLLLARDALGQKPLWLARGPKRLVFASEVRALLAAGATPRRLSRLGVRTFLAAGSVAEPGAILESVEALAPGHRLVVEDGLETRTRWFSLPPPDGPVPAERAAERVRACLERATRSVLEADVPVALLLSGGLDSSALALCAGRGAGVQSFHVRTSDAGARRAAELAAQLGFHHHEVALDGAAIRDAFPKLLAAQDQPSIDGANVYLIARAIHEAGLKAAVSGVGADELFLGYPIHRTYVAARRARRFAAPLRRVAALSARAHARLPLGGWRTGKLFAIADGAARGPAATHAAARALFPEAELARLMPDVPPPPPPRVALPDGASPAAEVTRLELATYLVDTLLHDADTMSMAHGVELRAPMLERELVETVVALPDGLKLRRGRQKPLLVEAIPELGQERARAPKEGFDLPFAAWLDGPLRAHAEAALHAGGGGLDRAATRAVWQRFATRRDPSSASRALALLALLSYAERHRLEVA